MRYYTDLGKSQNSQMVRIFFKEGHLGRTGTPGWGPRRDLGPGARGPGAPPSLPLWMSVGWGPRRTQSWGGGWGVGMGVAGDGRERVREGWGWGE